MGTVSKKYEKELMQMENGIRAICAKAAKSDWLASAKEAMIEISKPTVPFKQLPFYKVEAGTVLFCEVKAERSGIGKQSGKPYDFIDVEVLRVGNLENQEFDEELKGAEYTVDIAGHTELKRQMSMVEKPLTGCILAIGNKGQITGTGKYGTFRKFDYKVVVLARK